MNQSVIRQAIQQTNTQNHNEQANRHDNQQCEAEPTQDHGRGADPTLHAPIAQILRYRAGGHRGRVLPEHRHEHEYGRDKDQGESDLRDGTRGEGFDVPVGSMLVDFFVPAGEGGEEEEADEGEDDGDDSI